VSSLGSYLSGLGVLVFIYGVALAFIKKEKAADNPWGCRRHHAGMDVAGRRRRSTSSKCCRECSDNRRPRVGGDPVNTDVSFSTSGPAITGSPVKPGDEQLERMRVGNHCRSLNTISTSRARISEAGVADYIALLKPRVMSLVIFTALVGLVIAPGHVHPVLAFTSILCIAVGAGASGAFEHVVRGRHRRQDVAHRQPADPARPRHRAGSAGVRMTLAFFSVMTLGILVNWYAGALLAFTIFFYVVVYTMLLKRWTAQNIRDRRAAGALPPVVAWVAATGFALGRTDPCCSSLSSSGPAAFLGAGAVPQ